MDNALQVWDINWSTEQKLTDNITRIFSHLQINSFIKNCPPKFATFEKWFDRLNRSRVDATSITPSMAMLLFYLGYTHQIAGTVVACGCYQGLPLHFIVAGLLENQNCGKELETFGIDIDHEAIRRAKENAAASNLAFIHYIVSDAREWIQNQPKKLSILYLDLDDSLQGKADYVTIFELAKNRFTSGGLLLAHDAVSPVFENDIANLKRHIEDSRLFDLMFSVPVDGAGLLIAIKA